MRRSRMQAAAPVLLVAVSALAAAQSPRAHAAPADPSVEVIARGLRESHRRLLEHKGGVSIRYRLDFEEGRSRSYFAFKKGLDGLLNVKWPELRCRIEGPMSVMVYVDHVPTPKAVPTVREGTFNFETFSGVAQDGNTLGQIVNFRHPFSASSGFPLQFLFFAEMEQFYEPGQTLTTDYWLPNALEQHSYMLGREEEVGGVPCRVLRREGMDTLWVAPDLGYLVCKREFHYGVGKSLRERVLNLEPKEVSPGLWLPMRQVREAFEEESPNELQERLTVRILGTHVGDLTDADVRVVLPDTVKRIEDHITGKIYEPGVDKANRFDEAIERARSAAAPSGPAKHRFSFTSIVLLNLTLVLGLTIRWQLTLTRRQD